MPEPAQEQAPAELEIGKEYPPPGEDIATTQLRQLHLKVHHVQPGANRRGEHPKGHGGVWATFRVERDIPPGLRVGLFKEPRSFTALVRYSNGRTADDRMPDVHGMAVKVLIPRDGNTPLQQDFIMADHVIFFAKNVQHILEFLVATAGGTPASQLAITTHPALIGYTNKAQSSPLALSYWSQTPYLAGEGAVKYFAMPSPDQERLPVPLADSPDCLKEAMIEQLTARKLCAKFDFCVNPQTDAAVMPVEDPTIEWKSAPVKVATISIYPQKFDSPEQVTFVENLTWSPWDGLPEHRPLGGINRARQLVYQDSQELRHQTNAVTIGPITGREWF
ncbi:MAG: hypothetical protein JWO80_5270 [Bryobacterales bacterium]|jgi:hypothetical protein|nr:hypothetical protein [Bryobacterales bacterium]